MSSRPGTRRRFLAQLALAPLMLRRQAGAFRKIDVDSHITGDAPYLRQVLDSLELKVANVCDAEMQYASLAGQASAAAELARTQPRYFGWATTFSLDQMRRKDAASAIPPALKQDFANGAVAVKVPSSVGIRAVSATGRFLQLDDPLFEPVLSLVEQENRTLLSSIIDPRFASYSSLRPESSGGLAWASVDGEITWREMQRGRDAMMTKHPSLRVVAGQLGGMDLDEVARRLDRFPNLAVNTSLAVLFLIRQPTDKVRAFFLRYQDRILYGTGQIRGPIPNRDLIYRDTRSRWTPREIDQEKHDWDEQFTRDLSYFGGATSRVGNGHVKGLQLPAEVLHKLYYANAVRWLPGIERSFAS